MPDQPSFSRKNNYVFNGSQWVPMTPPSGETGVDNNLPDPFYRTNNYVWNGTAWVPMVQF